MKGLPYSLANAGIQGNACQSRILTFNNTPLALTDEAGVVAFGGLKVFDFNPGLIVFLGATASLSIGKSSIGVDDDAAGDIGLGTVTATNNTTLATTEQNLIPTTAITFAAGVAPAAIQSTATEILGVFDGTTTPIDVFLNCLIDDADHDVTTDPANLLLNGTLKLVFINLGDN